MYLRVAVVAHNFALRNLSQDALPRPPPDQISNGAFLVGVRVMKSQTNRVGLITVFASSSRLDISNLIPNPLPQLRRTLNVSLAVVTVALAVAFLFAVHTIRLTTIETASVNVELCQELGLPAGGAPLFHINLKLLGQESNLCLLASEASFSTNTESPAPYQSRALFQPRHLQRVASVPALNPRQFSRAAVAGIEPANCALTERRLTIRLHTAVCDNASRKTPRAGHLTLRRPARWVLNPVRLASSRLDAELIGLIKRPEPASTLLWLRSLRVPGLFNEESHAYLLGLRVFTR